MSVGPGRIEKRILKVLEWERQQRGGELGRLTGQDGHKIIYQGCDSSYQDIVGRLIYGCNEDDHDYPEDKLSKVYRAIYQSACRAIRNLERKGFVTTAMLPGGDISGYGWCRTVTLVKNGDKHLNTVKNNVGVNT